MMGRFVRPMATAASTAEARAHGAERVAKVIARSGVCSRRQAESLIAMVRGRYGDIHGAAD